MASAVELAAQRRVTAAFIAEDPYNVILSRAELIPNGAGGTKKGPAEAKEAQTVRLVPQGIGGRLEERQMLDGQSVVVDYHMVMNWNADVQLGDWFFKDGHKHEVVWVTHPGNYETKAGVTDRG